ncbi:hypothetical protein YC2023_121066 [Brassica napus]
MEGLIPFLYKAIVMYKIERSLSSVLFSDHDSPPLILDLRLSGDSDQNVRHDMFERNVIEVIRGLLIRSGSPVVWETGTVSQTWIHNSVMKPDALKVIQFVNIKFQKM